jgi:dihydroorotate dehydrogenase
VISQPLQRAAASLGTSLLRWLPSESAHHLGLKILRHRTFTALNPKSLYTRDVGLAVTVPGIGHLSNPIGLAAGFDKDCFCPQELADLGFSFLEIGTVTPRPQLGNPSPRIFRYPDQRALINRLGFNSLGATVVASRLKELNWSLERTPIGINIGKNKPTTNEDAILDYLQVIEDFKELGQYFVINLSSPNTPGLRDLANKEFLESLAAQLGALLGRTWLKLDPDRNKREFQTLVEAICECGFQGVILTNTHKVNAPEVGGQSGHPLMSQATAKLEWAYEVHKGRLPMVGVGGILSGIDVFEKIIRGALAVQIYTALVYRGPWVVALLLEELIYEMKLRGITTIEEACGSYYE